MWHLYVCRLALLLHRTISRVYKSIIFHVFFSVEPCLYRAAHQGRRRRRERGLVIAQAVPLLPPPPRPLPPRRLCDANLIKARVSMHKLRLTLCRRRRLRCSRRGQAPSLCPNCFRLRLVCRKRRWPRLERRPSLTLKCPLSTIRCFLTSQTRSR